LRRGGREAKAKPQTFLSATDNSPLSVDADIDARAARDLLASAAREAGALALHYFRLGARTSAQVQSKVGGSPVTDADLAADSLMKRRLREALPEAGWLSEETVDDFERLSRRSVFVIDPIDGTRAFVIGDPRWAVSAALIIDGRPIAGVVPAPALAETYAAARGAGATLNGATLGAALRWPPCAAAGPKPIVEAMSETVGAAVEVVPRVPSLAFRLCMAARGAVDFAVAAENSHDWDIAAADLVLEEAGARLIDASGERLLYNGRQVRRGALFAASEATAPRLIEAFRGAIGRPPN
jgi:myo-inositol-1(or 4)-monophosphatase